MGIIIVLLGLLTISHAMVGYRIGQVSDYRLLKKFAQSALYEAVCEELDDGRPIKLLELVGTHFQAGYAYGKLMGNQVRHTYNTFLHAVLDTEWEIKLIDIFLDWQYESYVRKQLPLEFLDELKGLKKAGGEQKIPLLSVYFERVLVISSFPGAIDDDILSVLTDQFYKAILGHNSQVQTFIQTHSREAVKVIKKFIKKAAFHCSFFAVWGSRTQNGDLFTMRNLDWESNSGVNENKLVTVWKIRGTIPHLTLGFPGILGALTGMSKEGITVHEAGASNHLSTELGFQWTLRFRYIMMHAKNLTQALQIWSGSNNTLGMNYMIGSANDLSSGHPAVVLQTMRGYTAYFEDDDHRENGTIFHDPRTDKSYVGGYSMKEAVFRTNHAYDSRINKNGKEFSMPYNDDSMIRYRLLKDSFLQYQDNGVQMGAFESVNLTAVLGDKGSEKFLTCEHNYQGINVISVTYQPSEMKMWAAFEYGFQDSFKSACCGVYVQFDMKKWFG